MSKRLEDLTEPELRHYFNSLAGMVEAVLPDGALFCLVVFSDPAIAQYVSNAERDDMIRAMRETADRLERREDVTR